MARPAPTPKQNFLQTLLIVTTVFLGMQLFCNKPNQAAADTRSIDDIRKSMQSMNSKLLDHSILNEQNKLQQKINDALTAKKLDEAGAQKLKFESAILVADTQLKAALAWNETTRLRNAFAALDSLNRQESGKPEWTDTVVEIKPTVAAPERFNWSSWKGPDLYQKVVTELTARNKTDLVWGMIPGGYGFIDALVHVTGAIPGFSYWFAAFLLALVVRAIIYPLAQRQLMWGRQMSQLAPMMKEIKEQYKDQPQVQQAKVMELYREYGINPMAGCGPALVQMPLFLFVYQCMLHYQFAFQNGTFAWINPATSQATKGFIAPNLGQVDLILIVIYGITLCISTLLQPVSDPTQIKQQRIIGLSMAVLIPVFMLIGIFPVPAAFVLYWTFTNLLATVQSLRAYRLPMPPLVKVNTKTGGTYPKGGNKGFWAKLQDAAQQAQQEKQDPNKKPEDGGSPNASMNGSLNGKTGVPVKHKPKKRK